MITEDKLKELGFVKQNEYWHLLILHKFNNYPAKLYYGYDGKTTIFRLN